METVTAQAMLGRFFIKRYTNQMEIKNDFSYGVIPLHQTTDGYDVLLVHQRSHRGEQFWTFPKGHPEVGESKAETALRELQEETGVSQVTLNESKLFVTEYTFVHESERINKRVEFFIGYVYDTQIQITQPHEVVDLRWCDFITAKELLSHQNTRQILEEVEVFLQRS
jgi:8-oxo-dGTP pyrophosphatase MutT (NUDIX family)